MNTNIVTLVAKELKKKYRTRYVVKNVSLKVETGQIIGLLGPNGAGKTTAFYMLVGLISMDHGKITLNDQCITYLPIYERARLGISYLPQESSIFRKLTVSENIMAVLELQKIWKKNDQHHLHSKQLDVLLNNFKIFHLKDHFGFSLSGGERRRVEIARAIAGQPKFILLDEPFSGVDPIAIGEIQKIIVFLKKKGIGILITDHNVRETLGICDYAYIINDGVVLAEGSPESIINNEIVKEVYLGTNFKM